MAGVRGGERLPGQPPLPEGRRASLPPPLGSPALVERCAAAARARGPVTAPPFLLPSLLSFPPRCCRQPRSAPQTEGRIVLGTAGCSLTLVLVRFYGRGVSVAAPPGSHVCCMRTVVISLRCAKNASLVQA